MDNEKEIIEFILNHPTWSGADDKAILRKAFYMLKDIGCSIIIPDVKSNPDRFISHLDGKLKLIAYAGLEYNELPYLVETPIPYVINLLDYPNDISRQTRINKLKTSVGVLNNYLSILEVDINTAVARNYTLNLKTRNELISIAWAYYTYADKLNDKENSEKYRLIHQELVELITF